MTKIPTTAEVEALIHAFDDHPIPNIPSDQILKAKAEVKKLINALGQSRIPDQGRQMLICAVLLDQLNPILSRLDVIEDGMDRMEDRANRLDRKLQTILTEVK